MRETDINISPDALDLRSFDHVVDISTATEAADAFADAHRTTYLELTGDPDSIMKRTERVLIVCDVGARSRTAAALLRSHGYANVYSLQGGVSDYVRTEATRGIDRLSPDEVKRYDRQIRLAGFGLDGQRALRSAVVTVVGAGGLGCPALSYLATAGVGIVRIVDHDVVDLSNLQRQPLYATSDVGRPKVEAAAATLVGLNPEIEIDTHNVRLSADNASELISGSSVVIDATDNFAVRYALNRTTVDLGIPLVYGSVYAFEGQMAVFDARSGPCYECLFPDPPTDDAVLDCATIGVLGAVTGVIGSLQASAALQLAAGLTPDVTHKLSMFDARRGSLERLPVAKRLGCSVCGA